MALARQAPDTSDPARGRRPEGVMLAGREGGSAVQAECDHDVSRPAEGSHADPAAAGLVHDLNNLLTVLLGSLEQLHRQPLDERGCQQLERAQWATQQAGQLTQAMLATTAAARGEVGGDRVVDLNEAVGAFGRRLGAVVENGCDLVLEPATGPLPVRLDLGELDRALLNLVRNAAAATLPGGQIIIRTAAIAAQRRQRRGGRGGRQNTVAVSVSDTGTGMAPEVVARVGEAFFTTKGQGSGLGLWTVRRFVQAAGGAVEIETALGCGTTVRLVLPRAEAT